MVRKASFLTGCQKFGLEEGKWKEGADGKNMNDLLNVYIRKTTRKTILGPIGVVMQFC